MSATRKSRVLQSLDNTDGSEPVIGERIKQAKQTRRGRKKPDDAAAADDGDVVLQRRGKLKRSASSQVEDVDPSADADATPTRPIAMKRKTATPTQSPARPFSSPMQKVHAKDVDAKLAVRALELESKEQLQRCAETALLLRTESVAAREEDAANQLSQLEAMQQSLEQDEAEAHAERRLPESLVSTQEQIIRSIEAELSAREEELNGRASRIENTAQQQQRNEAELTAREQQLNASEAEVSRREIEVEAAGRAALEIAAQHTRDEAAFTAAAAALARKEATLKTREIVATAAEECNRVRAVHIEEQTNLNAATELALAQREQQLAELAAEIEVQRQELAKAIAAQQDRANVAEEATVSSATDAEADTEATAAADDARTEAASEAEGDEDAAAAADEEELHEEGQNMTFMSIDDFEATRKKVRKKKGTGTPRGPRAAKEETATPTRRRSARLSNHTSELLEDDAEVELEQREHDREQEELERELGVGQEEQEQEQEQEILEREPGVGLDQEFMSIDDFEATRKKERGRKSAKEETATTTRRRSVRLEREVSVAQEEQEQEILERELGVGLDQEDEQEQREEQLEQGDAAAGDAGEVFFSSIDDFEQEMERQRAGQEDEDEAEKPRRQSLRLRQQPDDEPLGSTSRDSMDSDSAGLDDFPPEERTAAPLRRMSVMPTSKKAVKKRKERALSANLEAAERKIASRKRGEPDSQRVQFLPARGLVTESHHADDYDRTPFLPNLFNCDICEVQFQAGLSGFEHFWSCQQCEEFDVCKRCLKKTKRSHFKGKHTFVEVDPAAESDEDAPEGEA